jgi:SAM-dependent methyltransferase
MDGGKLEATWRARYDRWADQLESEHQIAGWSEQGLSRRLALVLRTIQQTGLEPGSTLLDLGAGPGIYTRALSLRGHRCLGLDYSWNVIKIAKSKDTAGRYLQGEAYHLPFHDRSFDAVLCVGVLQSLQSINEAMAEMQRVLKPGGYLLLDGLNSLFWLHTLRGLQESMKGLERRMSYYSPHSLTQDMGRLGLRDAQIYWLAAPASLQSWLSAEKVNGPYLLSRLFGYAFLLVARKQR